MDFDAGVAADPPGGFGAQRLMLSAMTAGADGLELDVHLSADGVPVVHHDATLLPVTFEAGDYEQLDLIYGHLDSYNTYSTSGDGGGSTCTAPPGARRSSLKESLASEARVGGASGEVTSMT